MRPVRLAGEQVLLREATADDEDDILSIYSDDRVTRWLSFDSRERLQVRSMLSGLAERAGADPRVEYFLCVEHPVSGQVIGTTRLELGGVFAGKIGYAMAYDHQGKGYGIDAVRTVLDLAFRTLRLHRVTAAIGPDNEASIRLITRLGFEVEGILRDHVFTNGAWRDSLLYSLLEDGYADRAPGGHPQR
jgi:ribosomal-protein-alanine N-acetyltransferase